MKYVLLFLLTIIPANSYGQEILLPSHVHKYTFRHDGDEGFKVHFFVSTKDLTTEKTFTPVCNVHNWEFVTALNNQERWDVQCVFLEETHSFFIENDKNIILPDKIRLTFIAKYTKEVVYNPDGYPYLSNLCFITRKSYSPPIDRIIWLSRESDLTEQFFLIVH